MPRHQASGVKTRIISIVWWYQETRSQC